MKPVIAFLATFAVAMGASTGAKRVCDPRAPIPVDRQVDVRVRTRVIEADAPTVARRNAFNAVQNTYLGTFQILGGLGLLLGSAGLGIIVLRNVLERRGELGLLLAVGFRPRALWHTPGMTKEWHVCYCLIRSAPGEQECQHRG